jgi:hypothetical protein
MYAAIQRSPVGGWVSENLGHLTQFLKFVIDLYATNAEEPIPYCIEAHLLCAAQTTTPEFFSMSQSPYSLREHQKVFLRFELDRYPYTYRLPQGRMCSRWEVSRSGYSFFDWLQQGDRRLGAIPALQRGFADRPSASCFMGENA